MTKYTTAVSWSVQPDAYSPRFRSDGLLVARYHKHNLYFEESFNEPPQAEVVTFDTPFAGRFGLIICFDILFHEPTVTLVERVRKYRHLHPT